VEQTVDKEKGDLPEEEFRNSFLSGSGLGFTIPLDQVGFWNVVILPFPCLSLLALWLSNGSEVERLQWQKGL
jgi:hypothetical protein